MKPTLSLLLLTALLAISCAKKDTSNSQPTTPLSAAIDAKYVHSGTDVDKLEVEYAAYKPNTDCDKAVYNAAIQTVQGSTGINTVTVKGANLTIIFDRSSNVQPAKTSLTTGTDLYKAVNQTWPWKGYLTIKKQNTLLTADQFQKAITVNVRAINTSDVAQITSKTIVGDVMNVEYAFTKASASDPSVNYEVQASTPITFMTQFKITCLIPDFITPQATVTIDFAKGLVPLQKDLGSGVTSYSEDVYTSFVTKSLSEYIAGRYFVEKVYPIVK